MIDPETSTLSRPTVTSFEESVWLLQQQQPERVLKQVAAWRVQNGADLSRLEQALQSVQAALPDLNARYVFSDDGQLIKRHDVPLQSAIERCHAASQADAVKLILARQSLAWDAEIQPPFSAIIVEYGEEACLALIQHVVLRQTYDPADIIDAVARAYGGDPIMPPLPRPRFLDILETESEGMAPIAWIRRDSHLPVIIGPYNAAEFEERNVALRWRMRRASGSSPAAIAAGFSCFVAALSGQPRLELRLSGPDGVRRVAVQTGVTRGDLTDAVLRALAAPAEPDAHSDPEMATPVIHVRLEQGDDENGACGALFGKPLSLPTLERHPDLALNIRASSGNGFDLELVTGQSASPHIGGFLLARLDAYLSEGDSALVGWTAIAPNPGISEASPKTDSETVAAIILAEFRQALSMPDMGPDDNFFDRGGHSLLATRIIGRLLGEHGLEVRFGDFFNSPTAAGLATCATPTGTTMVDQTLVEEVDRSISVPLALAQGTLWNAYAAMDFGTIFNLPFALDFLDPVDEAIFGQAFLDVLERHAGLRTLFDAEGGTPRQHILPVPQIAAHKWFWTSAESPGITLRDEAGYRFDLSRELPLRVRILRDPESGRQQLSFLVHHMAIDEWSLNTMMADLGHAYQARSAGRVPQWASPARGFHEFSARQQVTGIDHDHLGYWTQALAGERPALGLFPDKDCPATTRAANFAAGWVDLALEPDVADGLYASAKRNGTSLFTVVYCAVALALHRLGGARDITLGTSASGRTDPDFLDTVGYFTTMIAHRVRFEPGLTVSALIDAARRTINNSMAYADVPIAFVQDALGAQGLPFEAYVQIHAKNALHGSLPAADGTSIRYRHIEPDKSESMFDLQFEILENVADGETDLRLVVTYRADLYRRDQAEQLRDMVDRMLGVFAQPQGDGRAIDSL